jgi:hypothetical protein
LLQNETTAPTRRSPGAAFCICSKGGKPLLKEGHGV